MKRVFFMLVVVSVLFSVLGLSSACSAAEMSNPEYVAHRGYSSQNPDNTAQAYNAAANMNFYGIETDIYLTSDNVIICNHDATVKFADGSELPIATSTYNELIAKPLKNTKTEEDAYICTFAQ